MRTFGLIGYPLSHSFSPEYFAKKFKREKITDCEYKLFPLKKITEFPGLLKKNPSLCGLNVTIPFKKSVIPFLNNLDTISKRVGAVNCIKIADGNLTGYNTDAYGFRKSISKYLQPYHKNPVILGTGGAAKAVYYVLSKMKPIFISRKPDTVSFDSGILKKFIKDCNIIVNATPLGMHPDVNSCPDIPYELLTEKHLLFDLVYKPYETLFMKKGRQFGATAVNGYEMLKLQAEESWKIWNE